MKAKRFLTLITEEDPDPEYWQLKRMTLAQARNDPDEAYMYARDVIKGRWPEIESIMLKDIQLAFLYAKYVVKGRWPEAEPILRKDLEYWEDYTDFIFNV